MATFVWCELVCNECSSAAPEGQFVTGDRIPRKALKDAAKKRGWVFTDDDRAFCCDAHRKRYTNSTDSINT